MPFLPFSFWEQCCTEHRHASTWLSSSSSSWGYIFRNGIAGSYGNFMFRIVCFWRTAKLFPSFILHPHCRCAKVPVSPYSKTCHFPIKKMIAIFVGLKCYLIVVLICISLMANSFEHHFICHLCVFFSEMSVHVFYPFFKFGGLSFCYWVVVVLYIFWILTHH